MTTAKAVLIVIVTLTGQGHWFGGQEGKVTFQWTALDQTPEAAISWELFHGKLSMGKGRLLLKAGDKVSTLALTVPEVRVRTQMRLVYRISSPDGKEDLAAGEEVIHVYPRNLLEPCAERLKGKKLVVLDGNEGLPKVLKDAGIDHTQIEDGAALQLARTDIILVGQDRIKAVAFGQAELWAQARSGSNVVVFAQKSPDMLMEYPVVPRAASPRIEWRAPHEAFKFFAAGDLRSMLAGRAGDLRAIRLPVDEPALELVYWPREVSGARPVPLDVLMVTKTVGKGRVVLCQVPLGDWGQDPRSQLLLAGFLDYCLSRPEPTLPPSQRSPLAEKSPGTSQPMKKEAQP
jgi:hypothetical protein